MTRGFVFTDSVIYKNVQSRNSRYISARNVVCSTEIVKIFVYSDYPKQLTITERIFVAAYTQLLLKDSQCFTV
jgi:hypothetical protein